MNKMKNHFFISILISLISIFCLPIYAQKNNVITPPDHIKTVVLKPLHQETYAPIVKLGEKLLLSFDDINSDERIYTYRIERHWLFSLQGCDW